MFTLINEIINNYSYKLMSYPNVFGVGASFKVIDNKQTQLPSLTVFVTKKYTKDYFSKENLIPFHYKGAITDVIESAIPQPESLTYRIRPVLGGCGINIENSTTLGTAGCLVHRVDEPTGVVKKCMLTSGHLVTNNWNIQNPTDLRVFQPSFDPKSKDQNLIGIVWKFIRPSIVGENMPNSPTAGDAALIKLTNNDIAVSNIHSIGKIRSIFVNPPLETEVCFCGAQSGRREGIIKAVNVSLIIPPPYPPKTKITFDRLIVTTKMSAPGDSGGILVDINNRAVGLLYGSTDTNSYWCNFPDISTYFNLLATFED